MLVAKWTSNNWHKTKNPLLLHEMKLLLGTNKQFLLAGNTKLGLLAFK